MRGRPRHSVAERLASSRVQHEKLFRLADANAIVPRLQRGALNLHEEMRALASETGVDVADVSTEDLLRARPAARLMVEELEAVVGEIEETGAVLKDVQLGLIDFPAEREGEVVYLCWQFGEPEVAFWHRVDEGFAGRQPLPGSTPPRYLQ